MGEEIVMDIVFGGQQILMYICPNHPNERWDVQMYDDKMICIPCQVKALREEVDKLEKELVQLRAQWHR